MPTDRRGEWEHSVDSRLVSLTHAQKNTDDDIDEVVGEVKTHEGIIRGNPDERDTGLIGQVNALETKVNELIGLLRPDRTGQGGLVNEHNEMLRVLRQRDSSSALKWVYWGTVSSALIGAIALLITNWPTLTSYWKQEVKQEGAMLKIVNKAKHPRITHYVPRLVPAESTP